MDPITPTTPTFDPRLSSDFFGASPSLSRISTTHSRRSSAAYSPVHSRLGSSHGPSGDNLAEELGGFGDSLADELNGWNDEDEDELEEEEPEGASEEEEDTYRERDSGIDVNSSPPAKTTAQRNSLTIPTRSTGHQRSGSEYDGSEYGTDSDFEESQLVSAGLEARLAAVESLARRGTGDITDQENPIARATEQFKDLGGQSGMEDRVTRFVCVLSHSWTYSNSRRLTTAHKAITAHLINQTRIFQRLTQTILSPLSPPLHPDVIDDILPAITNALTLIAALRPATRTSDSLHLLTKQTHELIDSLSALSDTLHMIRQTSLTATRRLRTVRDTLREWSIENLDREEGISYIEQGGWDRRLRNRECASVCRDVLGGFEETCGKWRERLLASGAAAA